MLKLYNAYTINKTLSLKHDNSEEINNLVKKNDLNTVGNLFIYNTKLCEIFLMEFTSRYENAN